MPNLINPKSFNEKICYYSLNYSHTDLAKIVDKISFKEYIKEKIGEDYTAKLYGYWDDESLILFDELPNKFVIKSNLSELSNNIIFVNDKSKEDIEKIKYEISDWLLPWNTIQSSFCNWNIGIEPKILIEEYLQSPDGDLKDYKFFCFNGEPLFLVVISERFTNQFYTSYDLNWNMLPFEFRFKRATNLIDKPSTFDTMLDIAKKLSKPFPFVRVDFYEYDGKPYVGEMTFAHGGGMEPIYPQEWDYKIGELLDISSILT